MTSHHFLAVIRRWRSVVLAGIVIGGIVGWVSAPGKPVRGGLFEATHTLILEVESGGSRALNRVALLATTGPVPRRVAMRMGVDLHTVQSSVYAWVPNVGVLHVKGWSRDRSQAEALANLTADELIIEAGGPTSRLRSLERGVASPTKTNTIQGPSSRPSRALLLGGLGLLFGVTAAVLVERLNTRIRTRHAAEAALGAPVLTEVPAIAPSEDGLLLTSTPPPHVEAHRRLRTSIDQWARQAGQGRGGHVIVVTSPTGGEGKTATVAHLAAMLAESGRSLLVISADLRRPALHIYFGHSGDPGLVDVLGAAGGRLTDVTSGTALPGVSFVASGAPVENPSPLLDRIGDHLEAARASADFVLIDSPPLLTTSEGADLARHADGVLVVVRAGQTSTSAAQRSAELLSRLDIPVIGTVLIGGVDM